MKAHAVLLAALLLPVGCARPPPAPPRTAYERYQAALDARNAALDEADRCFRNETTANNTQIIRGFWPGDCMDMMPSQVMHGVWYAGFEQREFIPDVDNVPRLRVIATRRDFEPRNYFYLDGEEAIRRMGLEPAMGSQAYAITFVGRRSRPYRNPDGTAGIPIIVVDALLTGRRLGETTTCMMPAVYEGLNPSDRDRENFCPDSGTPLAIDRPAPAP